MRSPLNLKSTILAICLSVATAWHVHAAAFDSDSSPSPSPVSPAYKQGQNILAEDLSERFGIHVTLEGDQLFVIGTRENIDHLINAFNDIDALSALYMPLSHSDVSVHILDKPCGTWEECAEAIGIRTKLYNLDLSKEEGNHVYFPLHTDADREMTNAYVNIIKSTLNKLHWFGKNMASHERYIEGLFFTRGNEIGFDYSIINQFLGKITPAEGEYSHLLGDHINVMIPLQPMLQHIIAASHGDAHLVETGTPGIFDVHTTSLGEKMGNNNLILELVLDCSGSMSGPPLVVLNKEVPNFLKLVQRKLPVDANIRVNVISFSDCPKNESSFQLAAASAIPSKTFTTHGDNTDLRLLIDRIYNPSVTERKVVVGFTDGEHGVGDLGESERKIDGFAANNQIAYAAIQYVGTQASNSTPCLTRIAQTTGGTFNTSPDMGKFFGSITRKIDELLAPRQDFVFKFANAKLKVIWQPADRPGVFATGETVKQGDTINGAAVDITSRAAPASAMGAGASAAKKGPSEADLLAKIAQLEAQLAEMQLLPK